MAMLYFGLGCGEGSVESGLSVEMLLFSCLNAIF